MGQQHSTSVDFTDNWSSSKITGSKCVKCIVSCPFTQYSEAAFSTDVESSLTCKVRESMNETIAFGLVPQQQTDNCRNHLVGQREIYGSIGCHVTRDTVSLIKGGKNFFAGSFTAGSTFSINMRIRHGGLTFYVNGSKVSSEELEGMAFHGHYKLGVAMVAAGQKAEVFFDCPVTFKDIWSAGDVKGGMLLVKKSTNFTFYSEQALTPTGRYKVTANILKNCGNAVGLGTVPLDCKDICQNNLVGMKPGTVGCIIKNGNITVFINGNPVFLAEVNTGDPCVITMTISSGHLSFDFDGKNVDCDELKSLRLCDPFRVGVGLSAEGQAVEMRGDGQIPESVPSSDSDGSLKEGLVNQLIELLAGLGAGSSDSTELRWKDNMRSIDCDSSDQVAVCMKKFTATLYCQRVVIANGGSRIDIRILNMKPNQLLMVGVMDEDTENHSTNHLGASELRNSLGLTSRGDLLLQGSTYATGNGFKKGDLISLAFDNGTMSFRVNGNEAVPEVGRLSFKSKFRWAVSFTDVGQAVKIGSGSLTKEELEFCRSKGVENPGWETTPLPSPHSSVAATVNSTMTSAQTHESAQSIDDSILNCYIDVADLTYGGKPLGEGSFGKVFKGKWDESDVAIKEITWDANDKQRREIAVGRSLAQPNIATILGWSRKNDSLLVVMPLFRKGSLADRLAKVSKSAAPKPSAGGHFGFDFTFGVSLGLLRAIKYMASRKPSPVIHRDIKPANILLDDNDQPMLTDFGTARSLQSTFATTNVGTPYYMAAEQARDEGTTPATDVHAAAMVIYEVLCVPRPARVSSNFLALMNEIAEGRVPTMHDVPRDFASVLEPAFSANPLCRPTAAEMAKSIERVRSRMSIA